MSVSPGDSPFLPQAPSPTWRRASLCSNSGCVEVAFQGDTIAVRDSKRDDSPVLVYNLEEWRIFVDGVKGGEFDGLVSPAPNH